MFSVCICLFLVWSAVDAQNVTTNTTAGNTTKVDYMSLKVLPGIDTLGWGIDLRQSSDPKSALRVPLYKFDFKKENNSYYYPLFPQYLYRHPDYTFVRTASFVETFTYLANTLTEERNTLKLNLGVSGNFAPAPDGMFSGDLQLSYESQKLNTGQYSKITNKLVDSLYQIVVGYRLPLLPSVQKAIDNLLLLDPTNQVDLLRFIDRYGTHFVDSVMVGGSLVRTTVVRKDVANNTNELKAMAKASFNNLFGLSSGNFTFGVNFTDSLVKFTRESLNTLLTTGGNYSVAGFFSNNWDPKSTYEEWLSDLIKNAVPVKLRAFPIWSIFTDRDMRDRMQRAVNVYMQGDVPDNFAFIDFQTF